MFVVPVEILRTACDGAVFFYLTLKEKVLGFT
jgi:hypothetical protein